MPDPSVSSRLSVWQLASVFSTKAHKLCVYSFCRVFIISVWSHLPYCVSQEHLWFIGEITRIRVEASVTSRCRVVDDELVAGTGLVLLLMVRDRGEVSTGRLTRVLMWKRQTEMVHI